MNKKILAVSVIIIIIALGVGAYFIFSSSNSNTVVINTPSNSDTSITYKNTDYGFNFSLPADWQGYSVVNETWEGTALGSTTAQNGPKLLIRNPKWTTSAPYEDLPILVFTIPQWNAYLAEAFAVSAAPIKATELGRNNKYVFALPPRWDFDYSLGYIEAEDIISRNPLHAFNIGTASGIQGKLNINVVCEQARSYMKFVDAKIADTFVADCKDGKHPEVIERYKAGLNLGDGAVI
jgi:hypothetical protein